MNMKTLFRTVGLLEGLSFLGLLGIAMPMKYILQVPEATKVPGMIHGLLFLAYIVLAMQRSDEENWPKGQLKWAFLASVLPFGTLIFYQTFLSAKILEPCTKVSRNSS